MLLIITVLSSSRTAVGETGEVQIVLRREGAKQGTHPLLVILLGP